MTKEEKRAEWLALKKQIASKTLSRQKAIMQSFNGGLIDRILDRSALERREA
jgi:hypothetical protein